MAKRSPLKSPLGADLVRTNLPGVWAFAPPKSGAIHPKSTKAILRRHGVPLRPVGKGSERAARIWNAMLSRELRHIHPHLEVLAVRKPPPRARKNVAKTGKETTNSASSSANWSGGAVQSPAHKLVSAYCEWVVPTVVRPSGAPDYDAPWKSSTWVGLDGDLISSDVLQAGTAQYIDIDNGNDVAHYYVWYEWYPYFEVRIDNFVVVPGDAMFVYVAFDGPDANAVQYGHAWLVNLTQSVETSVYFPQPGPVDLPAGYLGNTAECIMETPGYVAPDGTQHTHNFPHFGEVAFANFGACSDDGTFFDANDLTTIGLANGKSDGELRPAIVCKPL